MKIWTCNQMIFLYLFIVVSPGVASSQDVNPISPPPIIKKYAAMIRKETTREEFLMLAREMLWEVFPQNEPLRKSLTDYVHQGSGGAGLSFAVIALIPFHDADSLKTVSDRILDPNITNGNRRTMLNAAPYIAGIGDHMYFDEGKIDESVRKLVQYYQSLSAAAKQDGFGHQHSVNLQNIFETEAKTPGKNKDFELSIWHQSGYLAGTLNLKDFPILSPYLDAKHHNVYANLLLALSLAANHDFIIELKNIHDDQLIPEAEKHTAAVTRGWWTQYLRDHPDGDWKAAILEGFKSQGYLIEDNWISDQSQKELIRAFDSSDPLIRYNAYRTLNRIYDTHFDLDIVSPIISRKYAMSFMNPMDMEEANEKRLKEYWIKRLQTSRIQLKK